MTTASDSDSLKVHCSVHGYVFRLLVVLALQPPPIPLLNSYRNTKHKTKRRSSAKANKSSHTADPEKICRYLACEEASGVVFHKTAMESGDMERKHLERCQAALNSFDQQWNASGRVD